MRKIPTMIAAVVALTALSIPSIPQATSQPRARLSYSYPLKAARCRVPYVKRTLQRVELVVVKSSGHLRAARKTVRYVACVYTPPTPAVLPVVAPPTVPLQVGSAPTPDPMPPVQPAPSTPSAPTVTAAIQPPPTTLPVITTTTTIPPPTTTTIPIPTTTTLPPLPRPLVGFKGYDGPLTGQNGPTVPSTITFPMQNGGVALDLLAEAYGAVSGDQYPTGGVVFTVTPTPWFTRGIEGVNQALDCSDVTNSWTDYSLSWGTGCEVAFNTPGQYTVALSFLSSDPLYGNQTSGPAITVDVTP